MKINEKYKGIFYIILAAFGFGHRNVPEWSDVHRPHNFRGRQDRGVVFSWID